MSGSPPFIFLSSAGARNGSTHTFLALKLYCALDCCPQVVVGVGDPNPLVASEGIATLERAGISVTIMDGAERQECLDLNPEFMARMLEEAAAAAAKAQKA